MNILLLPKRADLSADVKITDTKQVSHIKKVLKSTTGDTLKVGQIEGKIGIATVKDISANSVVLTKIICEALPPTKLDLTIVLALPRPKVLRRLIIDMTAMGVANIVLLNSYRTQKSYWQSPMLNRIHEFVAEGLQQAVDTQPPTLSLQHRFKPFVEDEVSQCTHQRKVIAHPYAEQSWTHYQQYNGLPQVLFIGAEGGWIDYEVNLLTQYGGSAVNLGSRILRTEAAVNALCGRYL